MYILTVSSKLKKYEKINGYTCESSGVPSFIAHLHMKFRNKKGDHIYSMYELYDAVKHNKIIISAKTSGK